MDYLSQIVIEIKKNDRVYRFEIPMGAPYGEAYDACFEALGGIMELAKNAKDRVKQDAPADDSSVEDKESKEEDS